MLALIFVLAAAYFLIYCISAYGLLISKAVYLIGWGGTVA